VYSQDGQEIKPPPEKSFLAKYCATARFSIRLIRAGFYLAIPVVILTLGPSS